MIEFVQILEVCRFYIVFACVSAWHAFVFDEVCLS